ncbi:MAG: agmatine deiminase family protein, partial [candidate division Zixibacteria bacterium]|nr:agmatine deiminase family protein [candidate division Zixibacteria bacterium]
IIAPTNSIWTRDYGPWFIFQEDGRMAIVDHIYNRPRPYDDLIPGVIGSQWGLNVYGMDLVHTGGNHMSDGLGMSMSTYLVYSENSNKTNDQVDSIMQVYLGNDYTVLYFIETGGIHHIDCWAKFLNPTTVLVKDVSPSDASYELLNSRADQLAQQISAWGQPYTVVRIYCPYPTAYTNSIILNDKVLVPLFNSVYDDDALQTYRDAMPGYEVLGFYGSWYSNDAIHCRAMGVPDSGMLLIDHVPLSTQGDTFNDYPVSARIVDHSGTGLIADSLKVFYSIDDGPYAYSLLGPSAQPDSFCGCIPAQPDGAEIAYYLQVADSSGRVETHPYIGEPWAHRFTVVYTGPEITSPDSFSCKSGAEFAYYPQFSGIDYESLAIAYSGYPVWLSVTNDSLVGTPPAGYYLTGFTVEVSDQYASVDQEVALAVYLCGDIDASGVGPPDIADLVYLVDYMFSQGPPPPVEDAANVDGLDTITITDLVHLVDYMFNDGPAPVCP